MENKILIHNIDDLKNKIYTIRGVQVMLDFDLAAIYGYETKRFNEQVKNNIERFDEDFRFQLTDEEVEKLSRSKFLTLNDIYQKRLRRRECHTDWILLTQNRGRRMVANFAIKMQRKNLHCIFVAFLK